MFIGHYAVGFLAKKETQKVSLSTLFIAVQFLDLLWPIFLLFGIERVELHPELEGAKNVAFTFYPYSHSLLFTFIWAICFGIIYWVLKKNVRDALIISLCVLSHWLLDLIVHFKDLPLYTNNLQLVGLGLWDFPAISLLVELIIFALGVYTYLKRTKPKNKYGNIIFWVLIILLLISQIASVFSPAPSSISVLGWSAQSQWLFIILAFIIDRNRESKPITSNKNYANS